MRTGFFGSICQLGIFVICAQTLIHFRPDRSYEKYLKLLVSIMILIQIFMPVGRFFLGGQPGDIAEQAKRLQRQIQESAGQAEAFSELSRQYAEQITLEELRRQAAERERDPEQSGQAAGAGEESGTEESGTKEIGIKEIEIGEIGCHIIGNAD